MSIYYFDPVQHSFSYRAQNLTTYFDPIGFAVNDKITDESVTIGVGVYSSHSFIFAILNAARPLRWQWQVKSHCNMARCTVRRFFPSCLSVQHIHLSLRSDGSSVDIQFTPIISIFATSEIVEGQLFKGHISSLLWKHDILDATLPKTLSFNLVWNASENKFILVSIQA